MTTLLCHHGIGDTYLVAALAHALPQPVTIVAPPSHSDIIEMFGHVWSSDPIGSPSFPTHPTAHGRLGACLDALTERPGFSQADMYRGLLGLRWDTPLARPKLKPKWIAGTEADMWTDSKKVALMPKVRSWPIPSPVEFWERLAWRLDDAGYEVVTCDESIPLGVWYAICQRIGWVIGTNSGGFQSLATAELVESKTLIVPGPPHGESVQFNAHFALTGAFPFSETRKFSGLAVDMDEHEIRTEEDWQRVIDAVVATGPVGRRERVEMVDIPITKGELTDRLAVATVKTERLGGWRAHRDWRRLQPYWRGTAEEIGPLLRHHTGTWELVEKAYAGDPEASLETQRQNRVRLKLQADIDRISPLKSY